jgi:hypothetical protein
MGDLALLWARDPSEVNHQSEPITQFIGTRRFGYAVVTSLANRYRGRKWSIARPASEV